MPDAALLVIRTVLSCSFAAPFTQTPFAEIPFAEIPFVLSVATRSVAKSKGAYAPSP